MYAARGSAHLVVPVIALVALAVLVCGGSAVASSGAAPRTGHAVLAAANGTGRAATAKAARPGWLPDVAATVPAGDQPSGAAVDPQTNTVYVASYGTGVLVINGKTDAVISNVQVTVSQTGCSLKVTGTAPGYYNNSKHELVMTPSLPVKVSKKPQLTIGDVSGCAGLISNGDHPTYSATYKVSLKKLKISSS